MFGAAFPDANLISNSIRLSPKHFLYCNYKNIAGNDKGVTMQRITIEKLPSVQNEEQKRHLVRYINFINSRPERELKQRGFHTHHIYPRSIAIKNNVEEYNGDWNLIELTPREHFIAHMILWKCGFTTMITTFYFMSACDRYDGRVCGRLYEKLCEEFSDMKSKRSSETVWMYYKNAEKLVPYGEIDDALEYGFRFGRAISKESLKKIGESSSKRNKNRIHVNNGSERLMIHERDFYKYEKDGFVRGRGKFNTKNVTGFKWMNNKTTQKQIDPNSINCYLRMGWVMGPLRTSNLPKGKTKRKMHKNGKYKYFYNEGFEKALFEGWNYVKKQ